MDANPPTFKWPSQIRFHQADPAGWMFYGTAFEITHDCFEDFIAHLEIPRKDWFESKIFAVPVRATEAIYHAPLRVGDHFEIQMNLSHLGESSLKVRFRFVKPAMVVGSPPTPQIVCLEIQTTHVFMGLESQKKCPIPPEFRNRLARFLTDT